ncbi:hypothetical protein D9M71_697670 [compost metagenome]
MQQDLVTGVGVQLGRFAVQRRAALAAADGLAAGRPVVRGGLAGGDGVASLAEDDHLHRIEAVGEGGRSQQGEQQGEVTDGTHGLFLGMGNRSADYCGVRRSNRASRVLKRSSGRSMGTWNLNRVAPSNL